MKTLGTVGNRHRVVGNHLTNAVEMAIVLVLFI